MLVGSLNITPLAALSRPIAGVALSRRTNVDQEGTGTLIVTLPGSPKGAKENLETLLKVLPHALELAGGAKSRTTKVHQAIEKGQDGMKGIETKSQAAHPPSHSHSCGHSHESHSHSHDAPRSRTLMSQDPSVAIASRQRQSPWPLVSVQDALQLIFDNTPTTQIESISVDQDLVGHVLSDDVHSPKNIPNSPSTNIDGYAVRCSLLSFSSSPIHRFLLG
jgi:gephyrin